MAKINVQNTGVTILKIKNIDYIGESDEVLNINPENLLNCN
jgi:hypothetical protein